MKKNRIEISTGFLLALALGVMMACGAKTEEERLKDETQKLLKEVIALHDVSMAKLGEIMEAKRALKADTALEKQEIRQQAIASLNRAHDEMMNWMRGFSSYFSEGKLAGDSNTHASHHGTEMDKSSDDLTARLERLKQEKLKIQEVDSLIDESVKNARMLLAK